MKHHEHTLQTACVRWFSDLIIVSEKKVFFVEMKTTTGRQNENQKAFQQKVEKLGFLYFLCRSFEEFQKICKENI